MLVWGICKKQDLVSSIFYWINFVAERDVRQACGTNCPSLVWKDPDTT